MAIELIVVRSLFRIVSVVELAEKVIPEPARTFSVVCIAADGSEATAEFVFPARKFVSDGETLAGPSESSVSDARGNAVPHDGSVA